MPSSITHHIEINESICGGKPCVAGTRIRVWDIHVWHDLRGQSPEEIVALYPQLSVADVHAALAYYLDHRDEIDSQANADQVEASKLQAEQAPSQFAQIRDELLISKSSHGDQVSP